LGLSIAKRIVEAHDGHIEVHSQVQQGSTFRVLLPIA
jgi:signal transduction histidine kinase